MRSFRLGLDETSKRKVLSNDETSTKLSVFGLYNYGSVPNPGF